MKDKKVVVSLFEYAICQALNIDVSNMRPETVHEKEMRLRNKFTSIIRQIKTKRS